MMLNVCVCVYFRVEGRPSNSVKVSVPRKPLSSWFMLMEASWRLPASSLQLLLHQVCV